MKRKFSIFNLKGFTLIELLVVMAIIAILAVIVIVAVNPTRQINLAKDANVKSDMAQIINALKAYFTLNEGKYPDVSSPPLQKLVVSYQLDTLPQQPDGEEYQYQRSATCSSSSCEAVVWGKLYAASSGTVWCWDSTRNKFQESIAPGAEDTTCP